ncbi:MAG TPA: DUF2905 domain-containing protein [candidate division WOR-3 bacterium]|uniref:DUF2905 domain-containing protein n=1 Tax=candidate division WOR-3 bacterium TaxID=2052148 RepID=A0A7C0VBN5_UNCW3|nr:DUF2905 domain-containing protein [candidate division WOR-3 bacterium]
MENVARMLILTGIILLVVGGIFLLYARFSFHMPGDIIIRRKNFLFVFPLATSILFSIVLTVILNLLIRIRR